MDASVTLEQIELAIKAMRSAFAFATAEIGKDTRSSGVVFAGKMLDESLGAFQTQLVQYFNRKMEDDAFEEGL